LGYGIASEEWQGIYVWAESSKCKGVRAGLRNFFGKNKGGKIVGSVSQREGDGYPLRGRDQTMGALFRLIAAGFMREV